MTVQGQVLLPQADNARDVLAQGLISDRCQTLPLVVYHSETLTIDWSTIDYAALDVVTVASAATVDRFVASLHSDHISSQMRRKLFVSIGPRTSERLRHHGLSVAAEASASRQDAFAEAVLRALAERPPLS